jgi:hypothetical protein
MSTPALLVCLVLAAPATAQPPERNYPYRELEGTVEEFFFVRQWRSYYWREDFSMLVRDAAGQRHRVISREPTPWNNLRLGTTFTGLPVDWTRQPRVRVVGVQAVDRTPAEFYDLKLEPEQTVTAFIVRVETAPGTWRDFYVNNWFHPWGAEADRKVATNYANNDPNYTIYGFLSGARTPFDAESKKLLARYEPEYSGLIYHGRIVKAGDGYEIKVLHLMGRHKKTASYDVFHGDAKQLIKLDGAAPPEARKKK